MSFILTVADLWGMISAEIGLNVDDRDNTGDEHIESRLPHLWAQYADKGAVSERLQYLYVKRACIEILRGGVRHLVDQANAGQINSPASQRFFHLTQMMRDATAEIRHIETAGDTASTGGGYSVTPARA